MIAGAILVYDITNKESFQNLDSWINEIKEHGEKDCKLIVVGNKVDLEYEREVTVDDGEKYAMENNAAFFETSNK
jgi:GTPase SAR1 family protein